MKKLIFVWMLLALLFLSACGKKDPICPPVTSTPAFLTVSPEELPMPISSAPTQVAINGKPLTVDKVVAGPLCNDDWSGTVYVTCDVQVYPWQEHPLFLKDCNLEIEPGTVVYVAYHNNTAYYNGCSCHTGEIESP
jgi:hypothetical protein